MQKYKCPICGCKKFFATAHIAQTWVIDAYGNFLRKSTACDIITHKPNENDVWQCTNAECRWQGPGKEALYHDTL